MKALPYLLICFATKMGKIQILIPMTKIGYFKNYHFIYIINYILWSSTTKYCRR